MSKKRVILVHGWQGKPGNHWKGNLRVALEKEGIEVVEPVMPNDSNRPEDWINTLKSSLGKPDMETVIVGHSLGCPASIGYLMSLGEGEKVLGVILVAGFVTKISSYEELYFFDFDKEEVKKTKEHAEFFVSVVSDNDTVVLPEKSFELNELVQGKLILEHNKGHFCEDDGVVTLDSVTEEVFNIFKENV